MTTKPPRKNPAYISLLPKATITYPGYVLDKAFSHSEAGVVKGYNVEITSNNTKYIIVFDAACTFIKAFAVH